MNIIRSFPPNVELIKANFPIKKNTVFTYRNTIYAPGTLAELPTDLIVHESTHTAQQGDNPDAWWERYVKDPDFRFSQELEAYRNQYRSFCSRCLDRNECHRFLVTLARDLAGPLYGGGFDFFAAVRLIKQ